MNGRPGVLLYQSIWQICKINSTMSRIECSSDGEPAEKRNLVRVPYRHSSVGDGLVVLLLSCRSSGMSN